MLSRYFISFNFAAVITFAIFFSMQMLISQGDITLYEKVSRKVVIHNEARKIEPPVHRELPPRKQEIEEPPEVIPADPLTKIGVNPSNGPFLTHVRPVAPIPGDTGNVINTEGDFIYILRPAPRYPQVLAAKGIEGYVRVKYTVTENGTTKDVVVMNSSHSGFERNAVKAVKKFKFKPRIEDGVAVAVPNVYNIVEFKLEN